MQEAQHNSIYTPGPQSSVASMVPGGARPETPSYPQVGPGVTSFSPPTPGSQRGSGVEWGLPWLLPQVYALAGGAAAGRHGQRPPRTAAEVHHPPGSCHGEPHPDARQLPQTPLAHALLVVETSPDSCFSYTTARAEALQSTFLLMSPRQLYEHFRGDYQTHDIGWSEEQAGTVLQAWQRRFVQVSMEPTSAAPEDAASSCASHHPVSPAGPGGPARECVPADPCLLLYHPGRHPARLL